MANKSKSSRPMFVLQTYEDRIAAGKELSQKLSERLSNLSLQESQEERSSTINSRRNSKTVDTPPPPPPPPPSEAQNGVQNGVPNGVQNGSSPNTRTNTLKQNKPKPKAPPVPVKTSTLSSYSQPPPCPTPDYDTLSLSSTTSTLPKQNGYVNGAKPSQDVSDAVEMESLESFKLNNPYGNKPKPPNTYFNKTALSSQLSNGSTASNASTARKPRPVSVTIGEYPSATLRKQPGRLDFLNGGQDERTRSINQPITNQLASELQQTLNRSNLKKRTESMENLLNGNHIKPQSNGSVWISLSNLTRNLAKSTNDLTADNEYSKPINNRVTININNNEKKSDTLNGILKNGNGNQTLSPHKPLVHQKSITFGEMPVVINDTPLHVT